MEFTLFEETCLNKNEKIVNAVLKRLKLNDGYCPCNQDAPLEDTKCPCKRYITTHYCCCTLYKSINEPSEASSN